MVLERLALAVALISGSDDSTPERHASVVLVDALATADERADAAERLRLREADQVRAVAVPRGTQRADGLPPVSTPWGRVGVVVIRSSVPWTSDPAGLGFRVRPSELPASWSSALVALRARRSDEPVADAEALGALVALVQAVDAGSAVPQDVLLVEELQRNPAAARAMDAVVDSPSLRAAASALGLHHSTLQARVEQLDEALGFDVSTPHGRNRLDLALALARVRGVRWSD